MRAIGWIEFVLATPVVLWCGWPFFERGWASDREPQPEHVHADRHRDRNGVPLQRDRGALSRNFSRFVSQHGARFPFISRQPRPSPLSCFSARCSNCARAAALPLHSIAAEAFAANRAPDSRRRHGNRRARRAHRTGRHAARASRRKSSGRWRRSRRIELHRRIAGYRRADSGRKNDRTAA